jgi:hypothetical protein
MSTSLMHVVVVHAFDEAPTVQVALSKKGG